MKLEEKIFLLRKEKGLTQLQVAEKIDVSRQAISKWESGTAVPSIDNLKLLGELYGVPVDTLLSSDDIVRERTTVPDKETIEGQKVKGRIKKYLIIIACVLILAVVAGVIYRGTVYEKSENREFSEMGSENWGNDEEGFSFSW